MSSPASIAAIIGSSQRPVARAGRSVPAARALRCASSLWPGLLCAGLTLLLCARGIHWARLHPDEHHIARWLRQTQTQSYVAERVYPGGYFELLRPAQAGARNARRLAEKRARWTGQGRRHAADGAEPNMVAWARLWNVRLAAIATLLLYLLALRITASRAAAALAALLFGAHPFLIEHGHYAETDVAMVALGLAALLLLTLARRRGRYWLLAAASAVSGAAIGCKYTLLPLIVLPPLHGWLLGAQRGLGRMSRWGLAAVCVALCALGFAWATPMLYRAPAAFLAGARAMTSYTYGEIHGLLGEMAGVRGAGWLLKSGIMLREALKSGWLWWLGFALALPLWREGRARRHLAVLPLFGLCFALYALVGLPWFRNQEFLPLLPLLAVTLALPLAALAPPPLPPPGARGRWRRWRLAALLTLLLPITALNLARGIRISSAFGTEETLSSLFDWLSLSSSGERRFGFEPYASRIASHAPRLSEKTDKVEALSPRAWRASGLDYLVRVGNMPGRGHRHPWTQRLYPAREANLAGFTNQATMLRSWRITAGIRPAFSQMDLEVWGLGGGAAGGRPDVPLVLDRPMAIAGGQRTQVVAADGLLLGPGEALHVAGRRHALALPAAPGQRWFAVVSHHAPLDAGPVTVRWQGLFAPREAALAAGRAELFELGDAAWRRRALEVLPTARVRMRGDEQRSLCLASVTPLAAHAAHLLRRGGSPERGAALLAALARERPLDEAEHVEAFLAHVAIAEAAAPGIREAERRAAAPHGAAAGRALAAAGELLAGTDPETLGRAAVMGTEIRFLRDFARIRLGPLAMAAAGPPTPDGERMLADTDLPLWLAAGSYRFEARAGVASCRDREHCRRDHRVTEARLLDHATGREIAPRSAPPREHQWRLAGAITVPEPLRPRLQLEIPICADRLVEVEYVVLTWDPVEQLRLARDELAAALAGFAETRGDNRALSPLSPRGGGQPAGE